MTSGTRPRVLVVDDEDRIRQLEARILEAGGYRVEQASSAHEAFAIIAADGAPDLLIADLDMPELSGEQMVEQIHASQPNLKVLYVTGHIDRLLDARSMLWDGEAFLDKPFTAGGLLEAVSLLLMRQIHTPRPS
jgi:two-component system, cell cycle sensor histidine kinase and response regulator CckA